jgi:hypothetical protein
MKTKSLPVNIEDIDHHIFVAHSALTWLAARCDYAISNDGEGFSATDTLLGHALAEKKLWSPRETSASLNLLVKYKKQLDTAHIQFPDIKKIQSVLRDQVNQDRLQRRDIIQGVIRVDKIAQKITAKTDYHPEVVADLREFIGARWDNAKKEWSYDLNSENAIATEELAVRWGFKLTKHKGWTTLTPARGVDVVGQQLLISGVNAGKIIRSIPKMSGEKNNGSIFSALTWMSQTSIAIPLRSWVMREASLWIVGGDDGGRLEWAKDRIVDLLSTRYQKSKQEESANFSNASALTLPIDRQSAIGGKLPDALISALMPHQWVAVEAIASRRELILADEQGLGKTIEILAGLEASDSFPSVVLAPATALLNWRDEAVRWLPDRKVSVLGGGVVKRDAGVEPVNANIIILNYESFAKNIDVLTKIKPQSLVMDEAQYLKGYDSERHKSIIAFLRAQTDRPRVVVASGTPVMNRPSELLTLLTLTPGILSDLGGFTRFATRYCAAKLVRIGHSTTYWDYSGSANLGELANRLRECGGFIRREKARVLPDLKPKERAIIDIEISNREEYDQACNDMSAWLSKKISPHSKNKPKKDEDHSAMPMHQVLLGLGWAEEDINALSIDTPDQRADALRRVGALRQLVGVGKIHAAIQWINENVKDEKLVVFAFHIEVQEALRHAADAAGIQHLSITGSMTAGARREAIHNFQSDANIKLIICSLKASQTAITLHAARKALIVEMDWTPSAMEQAEDRIHRIGQGRQVEITYLRALNTLDDRITELIEIKRHRINTLGAAHAPEGYKKDGTPRQQRAGPGRSSLPEEERVRRRKASKSGWQARNLEYMREYMRQSRLKIKIKEVANTLKEVRIIERLGFEGMRKEMGGENWRSNSRYTQEHYDIDLEKARALARKAQRSLDKIVKDSKQ